MAEPVATRGSNNPDNNDGIKPAAHPLPPTEGAPGEPPPTVVEVPARARNIALITLATLAVVAALDYAQSILIPVVLGIVIAYALDPLVAGLRRIRIPRSVGAGIVLLALVGGVGVSVYAMAGQTMQIVAQVPQAAQRVRDRLRSNHSQRNGAIQQVQRAATELQQTAEVASQQAEPKAPDSKDVQKVQVVQPAFDAGNYLYWGSMGLVGGIGQTAVILFLVYFFLASGDMYKRKIVKIAGPHLWQKKLTVQILDDINSQIESFMRVQVLTSALVGGATMAVLWYLGLHQWVVWGLAAGIFNSIPYLGPVIVTGGLGTVAFLQFDNVPRTLVVCGAAFLITSLEGFLLTPALMGRAARMNPVAVFVGLLFWSWIWGVWGAVLAVPMLMMLKAVCDHIEDLQPIGELLGE